MSGQSQIDAMGEQIELLLAERAVRKVVTDYFAICDDLNPATDLDALADIFTTDAIWEGKGRYREALGVYAGRDAIVGMLAGYARSGHFRLNAHYLASESIAVEGDGARACWMMLQVSTYSNASSDFRSAAIDVALAREADRWRICRFSTRHIFSRQVSDWNDDSEISVPAGLAQEDK